MDLPLFVLHATDPLPSPDVLGKDGVDIIALQKLAIQRFLLACLDVFPENDPAATLEGRISTRHEAPCVFFSAFRVFSREEARDVLDICSQPAFLPGEYDDIESFRLFPSLFMSVLFSDAAGPSTREEILARAQKNYDRFFEAGAFDEWQHWKTMQEESQHLSETLPDTPSKREALRL
jgi:hypothetical protein